MNQTENNDFLIPPKPSKLGRTVWTNFIRTITWIAFWLVIANGAPLFLTSAVMVVIAGTPVPLLLELPAIGISVLTAFSLCAKTFIKLDMADDIHKIRKFLEKL